MNYTVQENEKGIKSYRRFQMRTDILIAASQSPTRYLACSYLAEITFIRAFRAPPAFSIFLSVSWKDGHGTLEFRIGHVDLALVLWLIKTGNACLVRLRTPSRTVCTFF